MKIILNGKSTEVSENTAFQLRDKIKPEGCVIVDGYGISKDVNLHEGMSVCIFGKTEAPSEDEFEALLSARESPETHDKMKKARVGIAGLGGLGSNVAVMLVRAGIGHLLLVDRDTVDATNLNRQDYERSDIGKPKTEALKERLARINPYADVQTVNISVTEQNASSIFKDYDIVVEAFDGAENKAMLISTILSENPNKWVVSGNGVAGYGPANDIVSTMPMKHLVMCGDATTEARIGMGLSAPHVLIASAHEANAVLRLALGLDPINNQPNRTESD